MDNTVKETWIDKLVDELIDAKDEVNRLTVHGSQLDVLVDIILNSSRLDYNGESLMLNNESAIFGYLRAIYPITYDKRLNRLKDEREAERKRLEALEAIAKANDQGEKKEA